MITRLDAHLSLANSLGDSVRSPLLSEVDIPNGARYSTKERDSYLYRAMLATLDEVLAAVQSLERKDANIALSRLIPSHITTTGATYSKVDRKVDLPSDVKIAWILQVSAESNFTNANSDNKIPIHIISDPSKVANARLSLRPDAYGYYYQFSQKIDISDEHLEIKDGGIVEVRYIPYPANPAKQALDAIAGNEKPWLVEIQFENRYFPRVLQLASMYAWQDSEDLENAQLMGQTIKPIGVNNNANSQR